MTLDSATDVYYDPYRPDINVDPYPIYRRLRDEAPLYHNEPHDFFAVSRFEDVERCYRDKDTFSSARGAVLEIIRADFEMPPGVFDHPEQRRQLVEDPSLIPGAIEELLRFEPPAPHGARYVVRDVEIHGRVVPAGSVMLVLMGAANRDERQYEDPDVFDIHREPGPHLTFGLGIHFCLGAALARLEGRVALEEVLKRFPEWEVDWSGARLASTSTVRGWDALPVTTGEAP